MPTARTRRARTVQLSLTRPIAWHLVSGDCCIRGRDEETCGCGLLVDGHFVAEAAAHLWQAHREEALRITGWAAPWPCFADVIFGGARLPDWTDPRWTKAEARALECLTAEVWRAQGRPTADDE